MMDEFKVASLMLTVDDNWNIVETRSSKHKAYGYRFWPYALKGEGLFIAAFKKDESESHSRQNHSSLSKATNKEIDLLERYLLKDDWLFFKQNEIIRSIHKEWQYDISLLQKNLYLKKAGVQVGEIKGNDLVPHHELGLSTIISDNMTKIDAGEDEALQYLRKKDVSINTDHKGWALFTYRNFPLGWIKILHNRVNNYYPTEWRIRKE